MSHPQVSLAFDFEKTAARFAAWWCGEVLDRPPVSPAIKPARPYNGPISAHASLEARWFDVEYQVDSQIARLLQHDFLGDTLPRLEACMGPEITSTLLGCELTFSQTTSWSSPIVHEPDQWALIVNRPADFGCRYWRFIEDFSRAAIQKCAGRYLLGMTDLHGSYDILSGLRDPQALCLDLMDCPEVVAAAGRRAAQVFVEALGRSYAISRDARMGSTCWTPTYHTGCAYVPSCDFWCMVNNQVARELILPTIVTEIEPMERSIFHLDGPGAVRHLNLLLELPSLHAVQWVYGAGNGPAARWLDVYKRCRKAGKSVQVMATTPADALAVLEALGPRGLWLTIDTPFEDAGSCQAFLAEVERMCLR